MDTLYKYITEHSDPGNKALAWIECQTNIRTNHARMLSGAVQGRFLTMLVEMLRPESILEIGTFTGYSAVILPYVWLPGCRREDIWIRWKQMTNLRSLFLKALTGPDLQTESHCTSATPGRPLQN